MDRIIRRWEERILRSWEWKLLMGTVILCVMAVLIAEFALPLSKEQIEVIEALDIIFILIFTVDVYMKFRISHVGVIKFMIKNWIDVLVILPITRIARVAEVARGLEVLEIVKVYKVSSLAYHVNALAALLPFTSGMFVGAKAKAVAKVQTKEGKQKSYKKKKAKKTHVKK